ncbi:hypothetical protein H072_6531 [Dactylellina haptotyla CBS 200.50]|uniref:Uncharacterized protein n=1 Tax=Dactylellina haptotyla (strain CBS 200.50) TaxID=1284197 RepID=S8AEW8_DACHA|nr:hypothetical protein H072_6531 [Dactylellina haptotyla CBS 200.50]
MAGEILVLPEVVLCAELRPHRNFYTEMHTIAMIDPGTARAPNVFNTTRNRYLGILEAIALLLTTQPGENVAVNVQQYKDKTIVTFARTNRQVAFEEGSDEFIAYEKHPRVMMGIFTKLCSGYNLRRSHTRTLCSDESLAEIIAECLPKLLSRVKKLQTVILGEVKIGPRQIIDESWGKRRRVDDAVFHPYWLGRDPEKLENFAEYIRVKVGYAKDDPTWNIYDWLYGLAMAVLECNVDKYKPTMKKGDENTDDDGNSHGQGDGKEKSNTGKIAKEKYCEQLGDIISACATLLKAPNVEVVLRDPEITKRIGKVADYDKAVARVLEYIDRRKTQFVMVELNTEKKVRGVFPKDSYQMLNIYCDRMKYRQRKCSAKALFHAFPLAEERQFPSSEYPYGEFERVQFTIHPEIVLAIHLAGPGRRVNHDRSILIGATKRSCYWCQEWLDAFAKHQSLKIWTIMEPGIRKKKREGWRVPPASGDLKDAIEKSNDAVMDLAFDRAELLLDTVEQNEFRMRGKDSADSGSDNGTTNGILGGKSDIGEADVEETNDEEDRDEDNGCFKSQEVWESPPRSSKKKQSDAGIIEMLTSLAIYEKTNYKKADHDAGKT